MLRQIYKINRDLYARLYPTTLVFKDGSTITIRHPEPRQIIKLPQSLEECKDDKSRVAWQIRRRPFKVGALDSDSDDVKFEGRQYLRPRKR